MIELSDGLSIPQVGLCAFRKDSIEEMKETVKNSVKNGLRYFEIAELFSNGHVIMEALRESGLSRSDVYISLKLWPKDKSPDALFESCKQLIQINKFEYIDLIIIHAPIDVENRFEQWKALEQLKKAQLVNSLGAANITINHLMTILKDNDIAPAVFELEVTPFRQHTEIVEFCIAGGIVIISQDPCSKGVHQRHPLLKELAYEVGCSVEQLLFRWSVTKGYVSLVPPNTHYIHNIPLEGITEILPQYIMKAMDECESNVKTSWAPEVEDEE